MNLKLSENEYQANFDTGKVFKWFWEAWHPEESPVRSENKRSDWDAQGKWISVIVDSNYPAGDSI